MSLSVGAAAIDAHRQQLFDMSNLLAREPELSWQEFKSHDRLCDLCESLGFTVTRSYKGIATAFEARFSRGSDGPVVAFLSEFDALPGFPDGAGGQCVRHACGHNEIAIAGVAAALALKAELEAGTVTGTVRLLGTPAEETTGGKINLINAGAFEGVDFCMMVHPQSGYSTAHARALAMWEVFATFTGRPAHAAGEPWLGVNALDAAVQAYNAVSMMRQQLQPTARIHGIFKEGGQAPNIIPHRAVLHYYVRAQDRAELAGLCKRLERCFEAAALATGCTVQLEWPAEPFAEIMSNATLADRWASHFTQLTGEPVVPPSSSLGSTDMGNVTQVVPGIHPCFKISDGDGCHTVGFADAAMTEHSHNRTLAAAKSMLLTAVDVMSDAALLTRVKSEFAESKAQLDRKTALAKQ